MRPGPSLPSSGTPAGPPPSSQAAPAERSESPTAETRWQGANRGSFNDPEVDRLQNVVLTSFDEQARLRATIELHRRMSEVLGIGNLYYSAEVLVARNRVKGPIGEYGGKSGMSWNIFEWEVV